MEESNSYWFHYYASMQDRLDQDQQIRMVLIENSLEVVQHGNTETVSGSSKGKESVESKA